MSELIDAYKAQMPIGCQECPVFSSIIEAAECDEALAASILQDMLSILDDDTPTTLFDKGIQEANATLLDMATAGEVYSLRVIACLAAHGLECPTPKRGAAPGVTLPGRITAWLLNERICQNPGLSDLGKVKRRSPTAP